MLDIRGRELMVGGGMLEGVGGMLEGGGCFLEGCGTTLEEGCGVEVVTEADCRRRRLLATGVCCGRAELDGGTGVDNGVADEDCARELDWMSLVDAGVADEDCDGAEEDRKTTAVDEYVMAEDAGTMVETWVIVVEDGSWMVVVDVGRGGVILHSTFGADRGPCRGDGTWPRGQLSSLDLNSGRVHPPGPKQAGLSCLRLYSRGIRHFAAEEGHGCKERGGPQIDSQASGNVSTARAEHGGHRGSTADGPIGI